VDNFPQAFSVEISTYLHVYAGFKPNISRRDWASSPFSPAYIGLEITIFCDIIKIKRR